MCSNEELLHSFSPVGKNVCIRKCLRVGINKVEFINIINRRRRDLASPTESQTPYIYTLGR